MSFKDEFIKMQPGPAREQFLFNEIIKRGPPTNLVPVSITGPNNVKITYKVMPDYINIDGVRAPLAPATAQRVADYFKMKLPTGKISKQIYDAAGTKVRATPLSSSGYIGADGKQYSGKDVVESRISSSDAAIQYSKMTDEEITKNKIDKAPNNIIAGHGKEVIQPLGDPKDVSFGGWQGHDGKTLQPYTTAHKGGAATHSEYGLFTRLIANDVVVTLPNGKQINTTLDKLVASPTLGKSVSETNKPASYTPTQTNKSNSSINKSEIFKKVDEFLNQIKF